MTSAVPALPRKKLPVGIQTLAKLRDQGCYYVDKSGLAIDLIESGSYFFMSRPRRFGKSPLVSDSTTVFQKGKPSSRATARCSRAWPPKRAGTGRIATPSSASASPMAC